MGAGEGEEVGVGEGEEAWVGAVRQATDALRKQRGNRKRCQAGKHQGLPPEYTSSSEASPLKGTFPTSAPARPQGLSHTSTPVTLCCVIHTTACLILLCWPVVTMRDAVD